MKMPTILIADDDMQMLRLITRTLQLEGYQTLTAPNGQKAFEKFHDRNPDLFLIDVRMPIMDGFTLCQRVRESSQVPIIMLTALDNIHDKVRALNLGADDYVTKPFSPNELLARIQAVLRIPKGTTFLLRSVCKISRSMSSNILVLDTEVYSNTGGQASKSTPRGAVAKFAAKGKMTAKKDLGLLAMAYGNVYVAHVAMGSNDAQTLHAFLEAEAYEGPSLIIAYSHCIAHGIEMSKGLEQQKLAVQAGHWPLYRFNPTLAIEGSNPFILDSKAPSIPFEQYAYNETRYRMLRQSNERQAEELIHHASDDAHQRWEQYRHLAMTQPDHEDGV